MSYGKVMHLTLNIKKCGGVFAKVMYDPKNRIKDL